MCQFEVGCVVSREAEALREIERVRPRARLRFPIDLDRQSGQSRHFGCLGAGTHPPAPDGDQDRVRRLQMPDGRYERPFYGDPPQQPLADRRPLVLYTPGDSDGDVQNYSQRRPSLMRSFRLSGPGLLFFRNSISSSAARFAASQSKSGPMSKRDAGSWTARTSFATGLPWRVI